MDKLPGDIEASAEHIHDPVRKSYFIARRYIDIYRHSDDRDEHSSENAIVQLRNAEKLGDGVTPREIAELFVDVYLERLFRRGLKQDADEAEIYIRIILDTRPGDYTYLSKLLAILHIRYERTCSRTYVDESLNLVESAIVDVQADDPCLLVLLADCGVALLDLSEVSNSFSALEMAVSILRTASGMMSPASGRDWLFARKTLAESLRRHFEATGRKEELIEALAIFDDDDAELKLLPREVLDCCMIRLRILHNLWQLDPNGESLTKLRKEYTELTTILKLNHLSPVYAELLQASGRALNESFFSTSQRHGQGFNLIKLGFQFAEKLLSSWNEEPQKESSALASHLYQLGKAYELQFDWYSSPNALKEASDIMKRCCRLTSPNSTHQGLRSASMVKLLRMVSDLMSDSDTSVDELSTSSLATVLSKAFPISQAAKADVATELGYTAIRLFEKGHDPSLLDRAVSHFRKAIEFSSTNALSQAYSLQRLAEFLRKRGDSGSLEKAMEDFAEAVSTLNHLQEFCKKKNINLQDSRDTLGDIHASQYNLSHDKSFAIKAIDAWRSLFQSADGIPIARLAAATKAAAMQKKITGDPEKAAQVFEDVIKTLLEVMSDSDVRSEQIWKIRMFSPLSAHAASLGLIASRSPEEVLQLLERGRSMIWNRLLARKTDIKALEEKHHDLAQEFLRIQKLLSKEDNKPDKNASTELALLQEIDSNRYHLTHQYNRLIAKIRDQPGYEDFMLPEFSPQELRQCADQGPIITFVHSNVCHAVILTSKGAYTIELQDFDKSACERQYEQFKRYLNLRRRAPEDARLVLESILIWMWKSAAEPIISLIREKLNIASPGVRPNLLPRVWWICSGWINTFPIHLAGDHKRALDTGEPCTVMDMVISSYTPTIQALGYSRRTMDRMTSKSSPGLPSATLISMKITPNKAPDLVNAPMEVQQVEKILESQYKVLTMGYPRGTFQETATRKAAIYALSNCSIAHFACHGEAAEKDPLESRLCLYDWKARPLKVGLLMRMDFKHCQLVNLSACDMAVNRDQLLREEGLHMSGAFLMAGVPNVIATWWPILDAYSARVSRDFYTGLKNEEGILNIANAAESMHCATMSMRNEGLSPLIWGAYVHFGV
ncbi:hypothetical protein BDZ45DRAFT_676980 [Acephala macrosclerotiorum]|nr:hypothetical protein BDZ45DRAFT_676980 [Acephala macrosclerotiorum]